MASGVRRRQAADAARRPGPQSLRDKVMRGATLLAGREAGGIVLRLGGVLVLIRLIGPTAYGLYSGPAAIAGFVALAASAGTDVFLVRRADEDFDDQLYDQAFCLLAAWSTLVTAVALLAIFPIRLVLTDHRFIAPLVALTLGTPLNVLWIPAQMRLERNFEYTKLAVVEIGGDITLYGVSLSLAFTGAGVAAPVAGYLAWQCWLLISACAFARYRPRWAWSRAGTARMLREGVGFSSAGLIDRAGDLANPLVVGHFLGAGAVGFVALAIRICDTCTFVRRVLFRLSVVAFAKVQHDDARLRSALEDGLGLQLLAVGPLLAGACVLGPTLIPRVFGPEWGPTVHFLPYLAIATLVANAFVAHAAVLMVRNRIGAVVRVNLANFAVLFSVSYLLVPRMGITGYGVGEMASLVGCIVADAEVRRLFRFSYRSSLPWFIGTAPVLFAPFLPLPWRALVAAPAVVIALVPSERRLALRYVHMVLDPLRRRSPASIEAAIVAEEPGLDAGHLPTSLQPPLVHDVAVPPSLG